MKVQTIIKNINKYLAGEMLRYDDLEPFLDRTIDEINSALNSCYPSISEFMDDETVDQTANYNFFPDRYIRSVVVVGAAYFYYQADEEGEQVANSFGGQFHQALYIMQRDHLIKVPLEYQEDDEGYASFNWSLENKSGISLEDICGD